MLQYASCKNYHQNPAPETWKDVIPQTENVLGISTGGGYFFATYMIDAIDQVKQFDKTGKLIREITFLAKEIFQVWRKRKRKRALLFFQQLYHSGNYL
jgi:prolyl oligopeptidase